MAYRVVSKGTCPFCTLAKDLLNEHSIEYTEQVLGSDITREQLLAEAPGAKTVPQIFDGSRHIGGYTELKAALAA